MRSLGVDLASQPIKTAAAVVCWSNGKALVERVELGVTDARIVELAAEVDVLGIDAPFGWPIPFEDLLARDAAPAQAWTTEHRDRLRFRRTDFAVREVLGRWPLSVSSDLIAVPAMRCRGLLAMLDVSDRSGDGRVFEAYPALALHRWALPSTGYMGRQRAASRTALWQALRRKTSWLEVDEAADELLRTNDDALDALIASFIARAAKIGLVAELSEADRAAGRSEGWIAIPTTDSLDALASG